MNIFSKEDIVEEKIGKPVEEMNTSELADYIYQMYDIVYGYKLKGDFIKNLAILKKFQNTYTRKDAGRMMKYMFHMMDGKIYGSSFTFPGICAAMEWRNNKLFDDVKRYEGKYSPSSHNLVSSNQMTSFASLA